MQETQKKIRVDICVHLRYLNITPIGGYQLLIVGSNELISDFMSQRYSIVFGLTHLILIYFF